jgi:hypothetical protein
MAVVSAGRTWLAGQPAGRATNTTDRLVRSTRVSTAEGACPAPGRLPKVPGPLRPSASTAAGGSGCVDELAASLGQALAARVGHGPAGAQATSQSRRSAHGGHLQAEVDGLVGDPHGGVVG